MTMTFDEFKNLVERKTAQYMGVDLASKMVQEALAMDDAKDVIDSCWSNYNKEDCGEYTRQEILEQGAAAAANCIFLLI